MKIGQWRGDFLSNTRSQSRLSLSRANPSPGTAVAAGRAGAGGLLRLENIAAECPGLLEGAAEITIPTATYHGQDCQGPVTGGRLELRPQ